MHMSPVKKTAGSKRAMLAVWPAQGAPGGRSASELLRSVAAGSISLPCGTQAVGQGQTTVPLPRSGARRAIPPFVARFPSAVMTLRLLGPVVAALRV
jgi:hypothetical protein